MNNEVVPLLGPSAINHNYLILGLTRPQGRSNRLDALIAELRKTPPTLGVFSAELAATIPPRRFNRQIVQPLAAHAGDFRVLYYVRDHASRVLSQFVESVKTGRPIVDFNAGLETYFKSKMRSRPSFLPYYPRFNKWEQQFGERLVLRPFLRDRFRNNDIIDDFLWSSFDLTDGYSIEASRRNENASPSFKDFMVLRLVQEEFVELSAVQRHTLGQEILELMPQNPPGEGKPAKLELPRRVAEIIHETCMRDAQRMDAHFFSDEPFLAAALEKALAKADTSLGSLDPHDHLTDDEIRYIRALALLVMEMANTEIGWEFNLRQARLHRVLQK